eukprot:XP_001691125.1 predicted protein [Chlamydomonas reinhardtii]
MFSATLFSLVPQLSNAGIVSTSTHSDNTRLLSASYVRRYEESATVPASKAAIPRRDHMWWNEALLVIHAPAQPA